MIVRLASAEVELGDDVVDAIVERVLERLEAAGGSAVSPFLSVGEAAEFLRAKPQRVYDLLSSGRLTRHKDGSRVLVLREELVALTLPRGSRGRSARGVAR